MKPLVRFNTALLFILLLVLLAMRGHGATTWIAPTILPSQTLPHATPGQVLTWSSDTNYPFWTAGAPGGGGVTSFALPVPDWAGVGGYPFTFQKYTNGVLYTNWFFARVGLPADWDGNAVKVAITATSIGTNSPAATNVVFSVQAAAVGNGDTQAALNFGPEVWTTNGIGVSNLVEQTAVTSLLTVGNSPSASKGIFWAISRLSGQAGDTLTNDIIVPEIRVFYVRSNPATLPASSP